MCLSTNVVHEQICLAYTWDSNKNDDTEWNWE